jgi:hypothetical protein
MTIKKRAESWTQLPFIFEDIKEQGDLYVKYWIKLPSDLANKLGPDGWSVLFEFKTSGDYRVASYIYIDEETNKPYWYIHGDNVAKDNYGDYKEFWSEENHSIPVPEGKWFQVEFFWHRSVGNDGRFWWAINGKVIVDHHGPNKISKPINRIMLFTVYSKKHPLSQYVDEIEIWDGFPHRKKKNRYTN